MTSAFRAFLPNVIKFFPFPELVPQAPLVPLAARDAWRPSSPEVARLRSDPSFAADGALLYVHVPYCDFFCHYCPLYKTLDPDDYGPPQQERYVEAL